MAHIPDGVLSMPVLVGGAVVAVGAVALGLRRISDRDIPRVAILASGFSPCRCLPCRSAPPASTCCWAA